MLSMGVRRIVVSDKFHLSCRFIRNSHLKNDFINQVTLTETIFNKTYLLISSGSEQRDDKIRL